jgi:hypothetical protein
MYSINSSSAAAAGSNAATNNSLAQNPSVSPASSTSTAAGSLNVFGGLLQGMGIVRIQQTNPVANPAGRTLDLNSPNSIPPLPVPHALANATPLPIKAPAKKKPANKTTANGSEKNKKKLTKDKENSAEKGGKKDKKGHKREETANYVTARVDLSPRKLEIDNFLGSTRSKEYWAIISQYLHAQINKKELDTAVIEFLGAENLHLHNHFFFALLQNLYSPLSTAQSAALSAKAKHKLLNSSNLTVKEKKKLKKQQKKEAKKAKKVKKMLEKQQKKGAMLAKNSGAAPLAPNSAISVSTGKTKLSKLSSAQLTPSKAELVEVIDYSTAADFSQLTLPPNPAYFSENYRHRSAAVFTSPQQYFNYCRNSGIEWRKHAPAHTAVENKLNGRSVANLAGKLYWKGKFNEANSLPASIRPYQSVNAQEINNRNLATSSDNSNANYSKSLNPSSPPTDSTNCTDISKICAASTDPVHQHFSRKRSLYENWLLDNSEPRSKRFTLLHPSSSSANSNYNNNNHSNQLPDVESIRARAYMNAREFGLTSVSEECLAVIETATQLYLKQIVANIIHCAKPEITIETIEEIVRNNTLIDPRHLIIRENAALRNEMLAEVKNDHNALENSPASNSMNVSTDEANNINNSNAILSSNFTPPTTAMNGEELKEGPALDSKELSAAPAGLSDGDHGMVDEMPALEKVPKVEAVDSNHSTNLSNSNGNGEVNGAGEGPDLSIKQERDLETKNNNSVANVEVSVNRTESTAAAMESFVPFEYDSLLEERNAVFYCAYSPKTKKNYNFNSIHHNNNTCSSVEKQQQFLFPPQSSHNSSDDNINSAQLAHVGDTIMKSESSANEQHNSSSFSHNNSGSDSGEYVHDNFLSLQDVLYAADFHQPNIFADKKSLLMEKLILSL